MENLFNTDVVAQLGMTGLFALGTVKAIMKLYTDMRNDKIEYQGEAKKREDALLKNLDLQTQTNKEICKTLNNIDKRLSKLEREIGGESNAETL